MLYIIIIYSFFYVVFLNEGVPLVAILLVSD